MEKIRAVLIDVDKDEAQVVEFEDRLDEYYRMLKCDCIDIVSMTIGVEGDRKEFDIVCDDEGLFKTPRKVGAYGDNGAIYGNIIICNHEVREDGVYQSSLSDDDIELIKRNVRKAYTIGIPRPYASVWNCN